MYRLIVLLSCYLGIATFFTGCDYFWGETVKVRYPQDTTHYAYQPDQMDNLLKTVYRHQGDTLRGILQSVGFDSDTKFKMSIAPNDYYGNAGYFYPMTLFNLRCPTIIIIGQSSQAQEMGITDQLIFGSYSHWMGPYDSVQVSPLRDQLKNKLPGKHYTVNDSLMKMATSLEALIPYMQHINRDVKIVPLLVAPMEKNTEKEIGKAVGQVLHQYMKKQDWKWGSDFGIALSSNGIHYKKGTFAPFGTDSSAYQRAASRDRKLCEFLTDNLTEKYLSKIGTSFRKGEPQWRWDGAFAVLTGLWVAQELQQQQDISLEGHFLNYATSLELSPLPVQEHNLSARQNDQLSDWRGYAGIVYR